MGPEEIPEVNKNEVDSEEIKKIVDEIRELKEENLMMRNEIASLKAELQKEREDRIASQKTNEEDHFKIFK